MSAVHLFKGKDAGLLRGHPWIFSGAIQKKEGEISSGALVEVISHEGKTLGFGHFHEGTIAVRMLSRETQRPDQDFWDSKIDADFRFRKNSGITKLENTNVFRLVFGEGDGLPGLVIDYYNGLAVVQPHTRGMEQSLGFISESLQKIKELKIDTLYHKPVSSSGENPTDAGKFLWGSEGVREVSEYGKKFLVDVITGQKTGFFIDQRENRKLLQELSAGKEVLNTYCYSGGFSAYALAGGAKRVDSVDSSARAIELCNKNIALNGFSDAQHRGIEMETSRFLEKESGEYDIIVLDPPAFAKSHKSRHRGLSGYKRINSLALKKIKKGGFLFTFSCSQAMDRQLFYDAVRAAAIHAGRACRVVAHLSQPACHPVHIFHPEGEYLKGLVLYAE